MANENQQEPESKEQQHSAAGGQLSFKHGTFASSLAQMSVLDQVPFLIVQ